jgi:signal transduction histidine kinase
MTTRRGDRFADEQAALRRVAMVVARGAAPGEVFGAVAEEVGRVLAVDFAYVSRFGSDGNATLVGTWAKPGDFPLPVGTRVELGGHNLHTRIFQTHQPARVDDYTHASGPTGDRARALGFCSGVGIPVDVAGNLWGLVAVEATRPGALPPDTEARLAGFTELVATALANAESQAELLASRARIVAAGDAARKRIERNLHDGAQQRLVSLGLKLRAVQAACASAELAREVADIMTDVTAILDELREIASGLHPAALTDGGLRPALRTLGRRSAVPVRLDIGIDGRLPEQIELAAYYCVAEALTNAAKHAHATVVTVTVRADDGLLRLAVRDDGDGGATFRRSSGLTGLTDRVEALGGRLSLDSPPGAGTLVTIALPYACEEKAAAGSGNLAAGASPGLDS